MKLPSIGIITPNDFVQRLPFGGASGFILNLINAMDNKITIFGAGVNGTPLWKPKHICRNVFFVATYSINIPNNFPLRLKALLGYMKNRRQILLSDIDILYVHSPECAIPFLYGKCRKPIVFHQHGSGNPVSAAKFVWARNKLILWLFDQIHQAIYRRANWIISIDQLCLDQVKKAGAAWKTTLIMNAVDTSRFRPDYNIRQKMRAELSISNDQLALLFVGRLEEIKQVNLLIKSLLHIVPKFPLHLFIIGDGTKKESLKTLTQRLGISSAVHFLGKVSHDILHRWYNMADALVLPSKMEGVPMVILESLACGTPVVASSVGGIPELVQTGKNGILVKMADEEKIADAIISLKDLNLRRDIVSTTVSHWGSINVSKSLSAIFSRLA